MELYVFVVLKAWILLLVSLWKNPHTLLFAVFNENYFLLELLFLCFYAAIALQHSYQELLVLDGYANKAKMDIVVSNKQS